MSQTQAEVFAGSIRGAPRPRVWRVCATLAALAPLVPLRAHAQAERIRVEYAPEAADCPSEPEFLAQVLARTAHAELSSAPDTRTFQVQIGASAGRVNGKLVIRDEDAETVARNVEGANCAEVSAALAFAVALAVDPNASGARRPRNEEERAASATASQVTAKPARSAPTTSPPQLPAGDIGAPSRLRAALALGWSWSIAPRVSFGPQLLFERSTRAKALSSLGVVFSYLQASVTRVAGAGASFRFYSARPQACSFRLELGGPVEFVPCVGIELGWVRARGFELEHPSTESRTWVSAHLRTRARLLLGSSSFIDGEAALLLPFTRYRFVFSDPETRVHDVPWLAVAASIGVGGQF